MVHSSAKNRGKRPAKDGGSGSSKLSKGKGRGGKFKATGGGRPSRQPKEVVWDDDARREYLTGFSKRKTEQKEQARARAIKRDHEAHLQMRKEIREARRERIETNARLAREYYGEDEIQPTLATYAAINSTAGPSTSAARDPEEYENEELVSTVVVEDFRLDGAADESEDDENEDDGDVDMMDDEEDGPNANMFASIAPSRVREQQQQKLHHQNHKRQGHKSTNLASNSRSKDEFATKNDTPVKTAAPKRFTYESKAARRQEAAKQKLKRLERESRSSHGTSSGRAGKGSRAGAKGKHAKGKGKSRK